MTDVEMSVIAQAEVALNGCDYVENGFKKLILFQITMSVLGGDNCSDREKQMDLKEIGSSFFSIRKHSSLLTFTAV